MGFKLERQATIKNVNIRKEHHGDEPEVAVDVKLEAEGVPIGAIAPLLGLHTDGDAKALKRAWWDDEGDPRWPAITELTLMTEFDGGHWLHKIAGHAERVRVDRMKGFRLSLRGGGVVTLRFTLSLLEPSEHLIEAVAHSLGDSGAFHVEADPDLLDEEAA